MLLFNAKSRNHKGKKWVHFIPSNIDKNLYIPKGNLKQQTQRNGLTIGIIYKSEESRIHKDLQSQ